VAYPTRGAWQFRNVTQDFYYTPTLESISIESHHPDGIAVLQCDVVDEDGSLSFVEDDKQFARFDSVKIHGGHVRTIERKLVSRTGPRVWGLTVQDFTAKLAKSIIDRTKDRPRESAANRVDFILNHLRYPITTSGVNLPGGNVEKYNYHGLSVLEGLQHVADELSLYFYLDYDADLHMFRNEVVTAPFDLDDASPDYSSSFPYWDFKHTTDLIDIANAVLSSGKHKQHTRWRKDQASIDLYGREEDSVIDPELRSLSQVIAAGDRVLDQYDLPTIVGELTTFEPGLQAGMRIALVNDAWGIDASYVVTDLVITAVDPHDESGQSLQRCEVQYSDKRRNAGRGRAPARSDDDDEEPVDDDGNPIVIPPGDSLPIDNDPDDDGSSEDVPLTYYVGGSGYGPTFDGETVLNSGSGFITALSGGSPSSLVVARADTDVAGGAGDSIAINLPDGLDDPSAIGKVLLVYAGFVRVGSSPGSVWNISGWENIDGSVGAGSPAAGGFVNYRRIDGTEGFTGSGDTITLGGNSNTIDQFWAHAVLLDDCVGLAAPDSEDVGWNGGGTTGTTIGSLDPTSGWSTWDAGDGVLFASVAISTEAISGEHAGYTEVASGSNTGISGGNEAHWVASEHFDASSATESPSPDRTFDGSDNRWQIIIAIRGDASGVTPSVASGGDAGSSPDRITWIVNPDGWSATHKLWADRTGVYAQIVGGVGAYPSEARSGVVKWDNEGNELWRVNVGSGFDPYSIKGAGDYVVVVNGTDVLVLDSATGSTVWTFTHSDNIYNYVMMEDGTLWGVDDASTEQIVAIDSGGLIGSWAAAAGLAAAFLIPCDDIDVFYAWKSGGGSDEVYRVEGDRSTSPTVTLVATLPAALDSVSVDPETREIFTVAGDGARAYTTAGSLKWGPVDTTAIDSSNVYDQSVAQDGVLLVFGSDLLVTDGAGAVVLDQDDGSILMDTLFWGGDSTSGWAVEAGAVGGDPGGVVVSLGQRYRRHFLQYADGSSSFATEVPFVAGTLDVWIDNEPVLPTSQDASTGGFTFSYAPYVDPDDSTGSAIIEVAYDVAAA
jgi:hypothetical protein